MPGLAEDVPPIAPPTAVKKGLPATDAPAAAAKKTPPATDAPAAAAKKTTPSTDTAPGVKKTPPAAEAAPELKSMTPVLADPHSTTQKQPNTVPPKAASEPRPTTAASTPSASQSATSPTTNQTLRTGPAEEDHYPAVAQMETLTFGSPQSQSPIEERLGKLEKAVYQKAFPDLSLFDRTQQLKKTLVGAEEDPNGAANRDLSSLGGMHDQMPLGESTSPDVDYYESMAQRPENQQRVTKESLKQFALDAINFERSKMGLTPLAVDEAADKVALAQVTDMCQRNVISHSDTKGDNPDRRYTINGGNGALTESIVSNKTPDTASQSLTKATVIYLIKTIMSRQDDHDAIMNPDATHVGFALDWTTGKDKVIAVTEVVTNHGIIHPVPLEARVGEKLEIKGVVLEPYKFERLTLAWEANTNLPAVADDSEEALPYFPPLDYVAYANKSEKDYSTAMGALRTFGIVAAIAGGMFIPPVALAAPMIAMSGGMGSGEPKPVSDIPIHGGVKLEGSTFSGKIPLNKDGKEGIYYITIWGSVNKYAKPVPISRQAIVVRASTEDVSAKIEPAKQKKKKD